MRHIQILAAGLLTIAAPCAMAAYALQPYQTIATGSWADAVATGDINGDGLDDVVLATTYYFDEENDDHVFVFLQQADGTLAAPLKLHYGFANRVGMAMADLDGDGRMEVVVGHGNGVSILDWRQTTPERGAIRLQAFGLPGRAADDVAILDVDRDGALDIFAQTWSSGATIYFGDGRGGVTRQVNVHTPASGYNDLKSADLDNDGHADIVILSGQGETNAYIYYNDGTDDLSPPLVIDPWPEGSDGVGALATGDFNNDGRDDLAIMRDRTSLALFLQDNAGGLLPPQTIPAHLDPNAMVGHDLDLDGRTDLVVQHGGGGVSTYLQGAKGLQAATIASGPYGTWFNTQGVSVGDVNGDACPDVVVANYGYGLVIHPGSGCHPVADLVPSLRLTPSLLTLRLDNPGAATAVDPETTLSLKLTAGNLGLGALPPGCTLVDASATSAEITCVTASLAAGASATVGIPVTTSSGSSRMVLHVVAGSVTGSIELNTANNVTSSSIRPWTPVVRTLDTLRR